MTGRTENYASTTALIRRCKAGTGLDGLDGRQIFERAAAGEERILSVLNEWIRDIAEGIIGLIYIFNPEMVLIGGGVSAQEDLLIRPLREQVMSRAMPRFKEDLLLEQASLGNDAGLVGAIRYWLDRKGG